MQSPAKSLIVASLATMCLLIGHSAVRAGQYHVTVGGNGGNPGTLNSPWDLQYGLRAENAASPGDTIWVHGGTYRGFYFSDLDGQPGRPFVVRNWNNERVTIALPTTSFAHGVLDIRSTHTWYWGLEIMVERTDVSSGNYTDGIRIGDEARFNKIINCVIHDATNSGIADQDGEGTELYGNVVYYSGRRTTGGNAYAVYGQNDSLFAPKRYMDNFFLFTNAGYQLHMYTENEIIDNIHILHNVSLGTAGAANIMFNAAPGPRGIIIDSNHVYGGQNAATLYQERKGLVRPTIRGNRFVRGRVSLRSSTVERLFTGNLLYGGWPVLTTSGAPDQAYDTAAAPGNRWLVSNGTPPRPTGTDVFFRRNIYEPSRIHLVIYNWGQSPSVSINPAGFLSTGDSYRVVDVQNYYGPAVASGTYSGGSIAIPMTSTAVSAPVTVHPSFGAHPHSSSEFGTFIIVRSGAGVQAPSGTITASADTLPAGGGQVTLAWSSSNATTASIDQGIGTVALSGSRQTSITGSTRFTLSLTGPGGSFSTSVLVAVRGFSVPPSPGLVYPQNNSCALLQPVPIRWDSLVGASRYHVQVSRDSLFQTTVVNDSNLLSPRRSTSGLAGATRYYWRARTRNTAGFGPFSGAWVFATIGTGKSGLHFTFTSGTPTSARVTLPISAQPTVGGAVLAPGDEVGLFTPSGLCVGAGEWTGNDLAIVAWGDNPSTPAIDGLRNGERISFRAWRVSNNTEYRTVTVAYTAGNGIYAPGAEFRLGSFVAVQTGIEPPDGVPLDYALGQNYPNPFNPSTTIGFDLPAPGNVLLQVFDIAGNHIADLARGPWQAGSHSVVWDATGRASGVYYCRMIAGPFTDTRKLVLVR